ncbi:MAG: GPR endopeptidase [Oscillospiraceae bacterium]|nr:GPR endopeptidase [Oscillospiraceae bacterium]
MSNIRTDLAVETREEIAKKGEIGDGVLFSEENIDGFLCSEIEITNEAGEKITGRSMGKYITIEFGRIWLKEYSEFMLAAELIAKKIKILAGSDDQKILIAGLGNNYITADSIGPKALQKILITRHLKQQLPGLYDNLDLVEMSGIAPGVLGQTGMETAEIILSVTEEVNPSLVIIIDALASRKVSRLATTVQLSNTGISPGSGVGNHRQAIDSKLLGTKVISIGVPTVVDAATLSYDVLEEAYKYLDIIPDDRLTLDILNASLEEMGGNFFVTPKESDIIINEVSKVIGYGINRAFYEDISFEEMSRIAN